MNKGTTVSTTLTTNVIECHFFSLFPLKKKIISFSRLDYKSFFLSKFAQTKVTTTSYDITIQLTTCPNWGL